MDIEKEKAKTRKRVHIFEIIWYFYGLLFGPIEILAMYLVSNGAGLFKAAFYLLIISSIMIVFPLVVRLIFKIFGKEIFDSSTLQGLITICIASTLISWGVFTLVDSWKEGPFSAIILTVFLLAGIAGVQSIPFLICNIFYSAIISKLYDEENPAKYSASYSSSSYNYSSSSTDRKDELNKEKKKLEDERRKEQEYYEKNFKVKHDSEDVYDQFGNFIGTRETTSVGDWVSTKKLKDKFGNEIREDTTYYYKQ